MRVKIRHLLLVLAATVTAGAVAKLSDNSAAPTLAGSRGAASVSLADNAASALASASPFASTVSDSPPEETLARIFAEIEANRLGNALQLTEAAREVLKGQRTVQLRRPVKRKSTPSRSSSTVASDLSPADEALFQLLRKWRADTAREQAVPAYVILHDKTLRELAEVRPVSHGLLAGITGMGSAKIEHYGAELLELIRNEA